MADIPAEGSGQEGRTCWPSGVLRLARWRPGPAAAVGRAGGEHGHGQLGQPGQQLQRGGVARLHAAPGAHRQRPGQPLAPTPSGLLAHNSRLPDQRNASLSCPQVTAAGQTQCLLQNNVCTNLNRHPSPWEKQTVADIYVQPK